MSVIGTLERDGLIAGDFPTAAQEIEVTGPAEFKRGDVIALSDDDAYVLVDSGGTGATANAIGIMCDNISVEDGVTTKTTMYIKGEFAQRHLRFGGNDTAEDHKRRMTEIGLIIRPTRV